MAKVREKDVQKELKESAHKIWLAGLGAFAVAEEEGGKLFKSLIKKGEEFEKESRAEFGKVKQTVEKAREKAGGAWDQLGGRRRRVGGRHLRDRRPPCVGRGPGGDRPQRARHLHRSQRRFLHRRQ